MAKESKDWIVFRDAKGNGWSRESLQELIDGYSYYKKFLEILRHYNSRF